MPYCDEEEAAEDGGGETRPLNAFTSCGGPGVEGLAPDLFVMAAGALFNRLMIVELLLLPVLLRLLVMPLDLLPPPLATIPVVVVAAAD